MKKIIGQVAVQPEKGWLYYLDREMNLYRSKMLFGKQKKRFPREFVVRTKIKREKGYLYYCDKQGNIGRTEAQIGNPKKREKTV
ncbi:MAG: hypothetical protein WCK49_04645 [Myxococcaceae bacterium]